MVIDKRSIKYSLADGNDKPSSFPVSGFQTNALNVGFEKNGKRGENVKI